ncbi:MAG: hypothetical protein U1E76_13630 [Planctomycetota bacterium]
MNVRHAASVVALCDPGERQVAIKDSDDAARHAHQRSAEVEPQGQRRRAVLSALFLLGAQSNGQEAPQVFGKPHPLPREAPEKPSSSPSAASRASTCGQRGSAKT